MATPIVETSDSASSADAGEALLHFLYRAPIGLVQIACDGTVELINPMSAQLLMPLARDAGLDNLFDVLAPFAPGLRDLAAASERRRGSVCEALRFDVAGVHPGADRTYAISMLRVGDDRLMVVLADATSEREREAAELSTHLHRAERIDAATRMPNRLAILEAIEAVRAGPDEGAAILLVGCERLQEIGESFGEDVKDLVVERMARRLQSVVREADRIDPDDTDCRVAARIGGDEFVVLLRDLPTIDDAVAVVHRVLDALATPYAIGSRRLVCAVSVGVVPCSADERDERNAEDLLRDAHLAMRSARRHGGPRWAIFEATMRERAVRRGSVEAELRDAIGNGELFVVYQPIVSLQGVDDTRPIAGVEALVRWRHPERGIVPPVEFIGIAEESGLIGALGMFVLDTACRQFAAWVDAFGASAPQVLAVNLSRAQLDDPSLVDQVRVVLAVSGLGAERLQLEVTESLAAQDDAVQARLAELKRLGLAIALDDFGTGYSSLSSLHLLPVDTVKIDRSFVSLAAGSPHHQVLIEATIRVARSLGMTTVAEGIESDAQSDIVRRLGCDKGQGYLYARPLAADDLSAWIAARLDGADGASRVTTAAPAARGQATSASPSR